MPKTRVARNGHKPDSISTEAAVKTAAVLSMAKPTLTLANGIVLRIKAASQSVMRDASRNVARPTPPMWKNPQRGEEEPNENDPDYQLALKKYIEDVNAAAGKAAMLMGTEVKSVPDGMFGPWDNEWIEWVETAGSVVDKTNRPTRYLAWLDLYALTTVDDRSLAIFAPLIASSIGEAEVESAVDSFRSDARRPADPPRTGEEPDSDGDRVQTTVAGDRVGDGGAGGRIVRRRDLASVAKPRSASTD